MPDPSKDHVLEPISDKILESHDAECVKMDESSYSVEGENAYISMCTSDAIVIAIPATLRGVIVLESYFSQL